MEKDKFKAVKDELNKISGNEKLPFIFINNDVTVVSASNLDVIKFIGEVMLSVESQGNMSVEQQKIFLDAMINLGKMQKESK